MQITDKQIIKHISHDLTRKEAYELFTTSEGLKLFFGEDNRIEITPGGPYEIYFLMDNPPGIRGGEGCKVLSFIPNKMLSFTWNAPPQYDAVRNATYKTWVVLEFEDMGLTLTHLGWPEGQEWDEVYNYFDRAWSIVLSNLKAVKLSKLKMVLI